MHRYQCALLSLALAFGGVAAAQTTPSTVSGPKTLSAAGVDFGGLIDGYYSMNFNHPSTKYNTWRNFDVKANSFALNFAKLTMQHSAEPVGFTLELAAGRAMDIFHATEPAGNELYKHLFQAFVSVRPTNMNGFQLDFGKFVTSAGSEPTETHLNWNYSRSLLYANGPYYHFGARTSIPVTNNFSAGFQLINGWNNVEDNNSAKTMGFTTALATSKVNWNNNYYVGNEKTDTLNGVKIQAPGLRHFFDTVIGLNPSGRVSGLINFDYGVEKNPGDRSYKFYGYSVALRTLGGENFAFSPRYDWYKDRDGFITGGTPRTLQEFTLTGDYRLKEGLLARLEYRRDWSNLPFYDHGNEPGSSKSMNTLLLGFVVYFAPGR